MKFKAYAPMRIVYYGQKNHLGFKGIKYVKKYDLVNIPTGCTMDEVEFYPMFKYMEIEPPVKRSWDRLPPPLPLESNSMESVVGNCSDLTFAKCKL